MTGVIRPTTEVSVMAPIPSQWQLLPPFCPASPILPSSHDDPAPHLTAKEAKEVMKEAKKVMCRMVLLRSVMSTTEQNTQVAEQAFLEATGCVVLAVPALQIPDRVEFCKKLLTITTTVRGVFKKEAWHVLPNHYSFTLEARDLRSLTDYREAIVALLLINHAYLFKDSMIVSPVGHPAVIETIYHALWTTTLHEALDFDELDNLDNLFSIGGAAVHNTLLKFEGGIYKSVAFSPASSSAVEYKAIQSHNTMIFFISPPGWLPITWHCDLIWELNLKWEGTNGTPRANLEICPGVDWNAQPPANLKLSLYTVFMLNMGTQIEPTRPTSETPISTNKLKNNHTKLFTIYFNANNYNRIINSSEIQELLFSTRHHLFQSNGLQHLAMMILG
ncbi:hypothetical protein DFH29DRAFT_873364 [Suillus ampliporus]|nr:hypothetical protein DFH29DRAFT_873364 [Suillus ampliporus]